MPYVSDGCFGWPLRSFALPSPLPQTLSPSPLCRKDCCALLGILLWLQGLQDASKQKATCPFFRRHLSISPNGPLVHYVAVVIFRFARFVLFVNGRRINPFLIFPARPEAEQRLLSIKFPAWMPSPEITQSICPLPSFPLSIPGLRDSQKTKRNRVWFLPSNKSQLKGKVSTE